MDGLPDLPPPADQSLPPQPDPQRQQPEPPAPERPAADVLALPDPLPDPLASPPPPAAQQLPPPSAGIPAPPFTVPPSSVPPFSAPAAGALPQPPAGPPALASLTPGTSVVLPRSPRRRRWWLIPAAVVVLGGLAAGVVALWPRHEARSGYSLTDAVQDAATHDQVHFTQAVGIVGHEIVADAELDDTAQLAHVTVDLTSDGTFEAIIDRKAKVAYFNSDFFNDIGYEISTDWIKADDDFLKEQTGDGFDPFSGSSVDNPLAVGALVDDATPVEDMGLVTVNGEQLQRYRVTVPAEKAVKVSPQIQQQVAANDAELPDELVYDIYVGKDSTIHRTVVAVDLGTTKVTIDSSVIAVDKKLSVKVPAKKDTSDAADVLG